MPSKYTLDILHQAYKGESAGKNRKNDYTIHVSSLVKDFCPRKYAICTSGDIPLYTDEYIGKGLALTFELGNKIQSIVVNRFNKTGALIGTWKCLGCKKRYFDVKQKVCPLCKKKAPVLYTDTSLVLDTYGVPVTGNIDVLLLRTKTQIIPVEVKSIKTDGFDALKERPELPHAKQISLYLWMLHKKATVRNTHDFDMSKVKFNTGKGTVLYVCKSHKQDPFKTFTVIPDMKFIRSIEDKLEEVRGYTKTGIVPDKICTSLSCYMAKTCHVRKLCFEKDD